MAILLSTWAGVYGGIYDPGSKLSDTNGLRKDVMGAVIDSHPTIVRYPGGNFVSNYKRLDGVVCKQRVRHFGGCIPNLKPVAIK